MRWAARWYRLAVRRLPGASRRRKIRLRVESLEVREVPHVNGTVFLDLNLNGIQDPEDVGVAHVTVTATDSTGATETVVTGFDGTYGLLTDEAVRIEFSDLPPNVQPGRVAGTSGATVRFLAASGDDRNNVDLALAVPTLVTTQFYYDRAIDGANSGQPAILAVPYGDENSPVPETLATFADVGSVWGLTYQPSSSSVFAASFLKRHAGLGPNAAGTGTTAGGIYRIDRSTDPATVSLLIDLNTTAFTAGADPHPTVSEIDGGDWFHDSATLPLVGKRGLGDLDISPDGRTLYVTNLNTRHLIEIPINLDGTRDTGRTIRSTSIPLTNPAGSGITTFNAADLRPFAIGVKGNAVFVGVTYTAESSQNAAHLRAFVYAFDPAQGAFRTYNQATGTFAVSGAAPVIIANLTYQRGAADDPDFTPGTGDEISANWRPWTAAFDTATGQEFTPVHPEPWLTDIVFDGESMILGMRDRFGDQAGFQTGAATGENFYTSIAVGDILRAAPNGTGGWVLESNGSSGGVSTDGAGKGTGPGGGEFYFEDNVDPSPEEVVTGGLAQVPGFVTVAATGNDPLSSFSGGIYTFFNSDIDPEPTNTAGTAFSRTELYFSDTLDTFGSSNGLGDLEALAADGTVQVGDRVFVDENGNGIQDVGETGLAGVVLRLFQGNTQVDSVTSGTGGDYVFNDLLPNTAYEIRVDTTQAALTGRTLTQANQGTNDQLDSDATLSGTTATIAFTTGAEGSTNTSLDVGFSTAVATLTLGNLVFRDLNNNGLRDTGEPGIEGVVVELLDGTGQQISGQTDTTDASGLYSFAGLAAGTYQVRIAASNFNTGAVLAGFTSSSQTSSDPNDSIDNDDNGIVNGSLGSGGVVVSGSITLSVDGEPTTDGDDDANTNLTLDFGLVPPVTMTLGNRIWNDTNDNGLFDTGEVGIDGVTVELFSAQGTLVDTGTAAGGGLYTFAGLAPGDYRVRIPASNFQTGAVLANFTSSTITAADPDDDVNDNDDGFVNGVLGGTGFIESGFITLAAASEPITDGDNDNNTNLSLDFGVVAVTNNSLTLGDRIFRDTNNNGLLDNGETGISGVTVQLFNDQGTQINSVVTDSNGNYSFGNLIASNYRIRLPATNFNTGAVLAGFSAGSTSVAEPDNDVDNDNNGILSGTLGSGGFIETGLITLAVDGEPINDGDTNANTNLTLDIGVVPPVATSLTLAGTVWIDANGNGLFDSGESPMAGVTVQLVNPQGTVVGSPVVTNALGAYSFAGLAAGDYRVRVATSNFTGSGLLVGFTSSTGTNGATTGSHEPPPDPDNNVDNDDNGLIVGTLGQAGGAIESNLITLALNTEPTDDGDTDANTNNTVDFGIFRKFSVGNVVFNDVNNNGTQDATENGIANVSVHLLNANQANALVATTTTNVQGQYLFSNLVTGNYIVELAATNFNAGGALFNFQSSTGASNAFEPAPANALDKQDHGTTNGTLGSGGTINSGTITLGPNATMPTSESPNNDPTTPDNQNDLRIDFGVFQPVPATASIAGRVFLDYNNSGTFNGPDVGMQGVTLALTGGNLASPLTVQTDAAGKYTFTNLPAGTYTVTETQPTAPANLSGKHVAGNAGGSTSTANVISNIVLTTGRVATGYNFAEVPILLTGGTVFEDLDGDGVFDEGEPGIPNATVTLIGSSIVTGAIAPRTTTTNASGVYTFDNLTPGKYTLTETQPDGFIDGKEQNGTPAAVVSNDRFSNINLTTTAATSGGFNFGEVEAATIAGLVYDDVNDDGAQAPTGEVGIAGVKVRLTGTNMLGKAVNTTVTTGSNGAFAFTNLLPGTYQLIEAQPKGYRDGKETAGTSGGITTTNDRITNIALASGATATGYLFGELATADVVITQSPTSISVAPGGLVTITYTVRNRGTAPAAGVSALINLGGLTFVSANSTDFDSTNRTWTVGDLVAGASEQIRITYRARTAGTYVPSATVSTTSTELSMKNNRSTSTILSGATVPKPIVGYWWFLSSSTNAFRRPRR